LLKIGVLVTICIVPLLIVPAYSLECRDGAYIGRDNQGNEACRDIKTNQIIGELTSPVVAPSSNQANQPSSSNQNPANNSSQRIIDFASIIIIFISIIAIIAFLATRRERSSSATYRPTVYSQRTKSKQIRAGKKGENLVRAKLSQLDNDYHIFWDVNVAMPKYITYNDKRNLRTAQIDFVVVSKKGSFCNRSKKLE